MNRIPKFNIGETIYTVVEYKIGKAIIDAIIYVVTNDNEQINYRLYCADNKIRTINEAYIVRTLDGAKASALINADTIHQAMIDSINALTEEELIPVKRQENNAE